MIHIKLLDRSGNVLFDKSGENAVSAVYCGTYGDGDRIRIDTDESEWLAINLDPTVGEGLVFVPGKMFTYDIPLATVGVCFDKDAFSGEEHPISARTPSDDELYAQRVISLNPYDMHGVSGIYPHAYSNYVTRDEANFFERNAINGVIHTDGHWAYPYSNWAGGARDDLEFWVDFGDEVEVDKLVFHLRADFPHDSYWNSIDAVFDDGTRYTIPLKKSGDGQELNLPESVITKKVHLTNFKQPTTPLSWAGLSQIEVCGKYIKKEQKTMEVRNASNSKDVKHYTTERLREEFLITGLFSKDNIKMVYSHIDRIITCGIMPVDQELKLEAGKELAADYFLQRREMGVINIGGKGIITVDGTEYIMEPRDGIFIGQGNKDITFKAVDRNEPPKFYMSSCPAHKSYPTVKIDISKAKKVPCGSVEDCNKRVINQYIHPEVMQSCQLSMGLTQLEPGSNWNTMPCHTHDRRMEVYLYLDMGENDVVFHMMGEPTETRHIIMHNEEAVISPSWSIHSGVGTKAYSFIWAMCGENQDFDDMDHIETKNLR